MNYPIDYINQVLEGDCLETMKGIPDNSVSVVITDPPYMISSSVKIRRQRNPMKFKRQWKFKGKDVNYEFGDWDIFKDMNEYLEFTGRWFRECIRILKKGGHIVAFFDKHKLSYLVHWAEELKVKSRQCLFWIKTNPVPQARKVAFMSAIELCYWGTKETTAREFATFNYQLGQHPNYIMTPICSGKERSDYGFHPTQKPEKVISWIMKYLSNEGDIILDPFTGKATIPVVAKKLNRNYIACEISGEYYEMAKERLANTLYNEEFNFGESGSLF